MVPKPPSLNVYVFTMAEKPSNKLYIVYECLRKGKSVFQGAKQLAMHKNTLMRMMERCRYLATIARKCVIVQDTSCARHITWDTNSHAFGMRLRVNFVATFLL